MSEPIRFGGPLSLSDDAARMEVHMRVFGQFEGTLADPSAEPHLAMMIMRALAQSAAEWGVGAMSLANPSMHAEWAARAQQRAAADFSGLSASGTIVLAMVSVDPNDLEKLEARASQKTSGAPAPTFAVGTSVLVQWNDGNKYPGNVRNVDGDRRLVAFPNGREEWVPIAYLAPSS